MLKSFLTRVTWGLHNPLKPPRASNPVAERGDGASTSFEQLSLYLRVLGSPKRLDLLRKLQVPRTLSEINLQPSRRDRGSNPDRPISRQALERHLGALQDLGLVHVRTGERRGRAVTEYVVNHARLFVLVDELRRLSLIQPIRGAGNRTAARGTGGGRSPLVSDGPCLVVAYGPLEGAVFELDGPGPWIAGRARGLPISLPHDPFVSQENARISRRDDRFTIESLPSARNGTSLNWQRIAPGDSVPLRSGDTIGVGRSLLLVRGV